MPVQVYILRHIPQQWADWLAPSRTTQQKVSDAVSGAGAAHVASSRHSLHLHPTAVRNNADTWFNRGSPVNRVCCTTELLLCSGYAVAGAAKAAHEQAAGAFDSANAAVDGGLDAVSQKAKVRRLCNVRMPCRLLILPARVMPQSRCLGVVSCLEKDLERRETCPEEEVGSATLAAFCETKHEG